MELAEGGDLLDFIKVRRLIPDPYLTSLSLLELINEFQISADIF
jgi:hypothetical protein